MHRLVLAAAALAAVAIVPASAGAGTRTLSGVVVSRSHGTELVATRAGRVVAQKGHDAVGSRLAGGRVVGHASKATIHGVVVKTKGALIFVASNRHVVKIRDGRGLASASPSTPAPGTIVTSTVTVGSGGTLTEDTEDDQGTDTSGTITIQATIDAVGPGTVTLNINGTDITVNLPDGLTLPDSLVGQTVTFTISVGNDDDQGDDSGGGGDGGGSGGGGDG